MQNSVALHALTVTFSGRGQFLHRQSHWLRQFGLNFVYILFKQWLFQGSIMDVWNNVLSDDVVVAVDNVDDDVLIVVILTLMLKMIT